MNIELSENEFQVLQEVANGYNNREIAKRLFLSFATVKATIISLKNKLGAVNRTNAVYIAYKNNILK